MSKHIALVTGGTGGIGTCICQQLAKDGYTVVANHIAAEADKAKAWLAEQRAAGYDDKTRQAADPYDAALLGRIQVQRVVDEERHDGQRIDNRQQCDQRLEINHGFALSWGAGGFAPKSCNKRLNSGLLRSSLAPVATNSSTCAAGKVKAVGMRKSASRRRTSSS